MLPIALRINFCPWPISSWVGHCLSLLSYPTYHSSLLSVYFKHTGLLALPQTAQLLSSKIFSEHWIRLLFSKCSFCFLPEWVEYTFPLSDHDFSHEACSSQWVVSRQKGNKDLIRVCSIGACLFAPSATASRTFPGWSPNEEKYESKLNSLSCKAAEPTLANSHRNGIKSVVWSNWVLGSFVMQRFCGVNWLIQPSILKLIPLLSQSIFIVFICPLLFCLL